jgi:hypothetical protein
MTEPSPLVRVRGGRGVVRRVDRPNTAPGGLRAGATGRAFSHARALGLEPTPTASRSGYGSRSTESCSLTPADQAVRSKNSFQKEGTRS